MIPKYLRLSGFLSYRDATELDFTSFDLACISGHNGAGKSSLLDAITWVLFGQARRRDDAIINSYTNCAEIIFDFWYEDNLYRVQRSKPTGKTALLELYVDDGGRWKPLTEHTLRETEARIQRILRMDFETFTNASFFLQGKADQFAQQRPGDRKRILSSILGLEMWEVYRERAVERRKRSENELNAADSILREINDELNQEEQRRARLKELQENLERLVELRQAKRQPLTTCAVSKIRSTSSAAWSICSPGSSRRWKSASRRAVPACRNVRTSARITSSAWRPPPKSKQPTRTGWLPAPTSSVGTALHRTSGSTRRSVRRR
jgi:DNA repair protein SbcC/Rad50